MGDRPNVHAENLLDAGKRYGNAKLQAERVLYAWARGNPRDELDEAFKAAREAEDDLLRAARSYATRMRRKSRVALDQAREEGRDG